MNIKQKIRSTIDKMSRRFGKNKNANVRSNSELGADEVIKKEVFPNKPVKKSSRKKAELQNKQCGKRCQSIAEQAEDSDVQPTPKSRKNCTHKPLSKRTRPTNQNYTMIDPNGDTCDTGKS